MISITIDGVDELFTRLDAAQRNEVLRPPTVRGLARLQATMTEYPAPPPRSQYRRTGNYGRSWTQEVTTDGDGITGTLGNAVRGPRGQAYGPYVGSQEMQAAIHAGRWIHDEGAIEQNMDAIERDYVESIEDALDG